MSERSLVLGVAGLYALVLSAAAIGKVDSLRKWSRLVGEITPVGHPLRPLLLHGLPILEATVVLFLVLDPTRGLLAAGGLLLVLAAGAAALLPRLRGHECNCFGAIAHGTLNGWLVVRNACLAAGAAGIGLGARDLPAAPMPVAYVGSVGLVGMAILLVAQFQQFLSIEAVTRIDGGEPMT